MITVEDLRGLMSGTEWQSRASCRPSNSDLPSTVFLAELHEKHEERGGAWDPDAALACCEACTVKAECAAFAVSRGIRFGVWGGRLLGRDPQVSGRRLQRDRMHLPRTGARR